MIQKLIFATSFLCLTLAGTPSQNRGGGSNILMGKQDNIRQTKSSSHDAFGAKSYKNIKSKGTVRIGIAKIPISSCGNMGEWSLHDELYGGALWIDNGNSPVVMITLDYVEMPRRQTNAIKREITRMTGIAADQILISCSHTHSGMDPDNVKLGTLLGKVTLQAREKAEPAQVAYRRYNATGFCINRRVKPGNQLGDFTMNYNRGTNVSVEKGTVDARGQVEDFIRYGVNIYSPAYSTRGVRQDKKPSSLAQAVLNKIPKELYLSGPVDPDFEVLAFRRDDGTSIGTVVRFSCHPVIFSGSTFKQFSADYPGVLTREISKTTGSPTIFINGPCGDIKPVFTDYGEAETERFGKALARLVTDSLAALKAKPLTSFLYIHREEDFEVASDMRNSKPADFAGFDSLSNTNFDPVVLKKKLDLMMRGWAIGFYKLKQEKLQLPFSLLGFNHIAIVTLPGEIFAEHSLAVKKLYPDKPIMIGELTDTNEAGYVPAMEDFADGGYEVSCATIVPGSGEKMVQITAAMLNAFYKGK